MATDRIVPAQLHPFARPAAEAASFVNIVSGHGATVTDDHGNDYVDALGSLWYCQIGHGREEMAEAIAAQCRTLAGFHTFDRFANPPAEALCAELVGMAPMDGARVFLTSGGSEAVESAIKLARMAQVRSGHSERTLIVSRRPSYHGVTYGAMSATGLPPNQEGWGALLPDMVQVDRDDLDKLDALLAEEGSRLAAIIAEPVIGAAGVYPPAPGYLAGLRERCDRLGAYLILDEVVCAFGRLGTWWAAEYFDVRPDLVTFAKGVTSGYQPVGGVLVGRAVREPLEADPAFLLRHGNTYSGHPAGCAAGLANLAIMRREGLLGRSVEVGAALRSGLESLVDGSRVTEVRGAGAVWALGFGPGADAVAVRNAMLARGVIARPIGPSTMAFCPPLVITDAEMDHLVSATGEAIVAC
ncbi:MAG: aspartate aminotransferase family protein [Acidimicrobiales bacterium]